MRQCTGLAYRYNLLDQIVLLCPYTMILHLMVYDDIAFDRLGLRYSRNVRSCSTAHLKPVFLRQDVLPLSSYFPITGPSLCCRFHKM
jgi:hypothetical protein